MKIEKVTTGYDMFLTQREQPAIKDVEKLSSDSITVPMSQNGFRGNNLGNSISLNTNYFTAYNNIKFNGRANCQMFIREQKSENQEDLTDETYKKVVEKEYETFGNDREYKLFLAQSQSAKILAANNLITKCNLLCLSQATKLSDLTLAQKKKYLALLLSHSSTFMSKEFQEQYEGAIIPQNSAEFSKVINELKNSDNSNFGINEDDLRKDFCKSDKNDIKLDYSEKDFIKDVKKITDNLPDSEKKKIWDYFGFEIESLKDGSAILKGQPSIAGDNKKLSLITSSATRQAILKIKPYIGYLNELHPINDTHRIIIEKTSKGSFDKILSALPEVYAILGQDSNISIDNYTFEVLKNQVSRPEFLSLTGAAQKEALMDTILKMTQDNTKTQD